MDQEYIALKNYLDKTVGHFRSNLRKVYEGDQKVFTAEKMMNGFTKIYNLALGKEQQSGKLYDLYGTYNKVFLKESLQLIKDSRQELLDEFIKQYRDFEYFTRHQYTYFNYLDRSYVQLTNGKLKLKEFSKSQFEYEFFREIRQAIVAEFLKKLQEVRESGDKQKQLLLQQIFEIIFEIKKWSGEFYMNFKNEILVDSAVYYEKKYRDIEMNNSMFETILLINKINKKENENFCLIFSMDEEFKQSLKKTFNDKMIRELKNKISEANNDYLEQILDQERLAEFTIMIDLFSQLNDQLDQVRQIFYKFLQAKSKIIMFQQIDQFSSIELSGIQKLEHDKHKIEELIQHQEKYIEIIKNHTGDNQILRAELTRSIEWTLNQNQQSVMIALLNYFDGIIAQKNYMQEEKIRQAVRLFKCFPEKDQFIRNYQIKLQKRLLLTKKVQLDDEKFILNQIGLVCGPEHIKDLQSMLKDLENEQNAYINYISEFNVVIQPYILCQQAWPQPPPTTSQEFIPLTFLKEEFLQHYLNLNPSNRIKNVKYHDQYSELVLQFKTDQTYRAIVSVPQAQILYQFQSNNEGIRPDMLNTLLQYPEDFKQNVHQLIKSQLLIENLGFIQFNTNFSSRKVQLKVTMIFNECLIKLVDLNGDRAAAIEAAIVRIMKSRKKLSFSELFAQAKKNLKMFDPKDAKIKDVIENLISREFLQRDPDNMNELIYVS